jgi:hypothetical protein
LLGKSALASLLTFVAGRLAVPLLLSAALPGSLMVTNDAAGNGTTYAMMHKVAGKSADTAPFMQPLA